MCFLSVAFLRLLFVDPPKEAKSFGLYTHSNTKQGSLAVDRMVIVSTLFVWDKVM
jgi:hypothetical protein